MTGNPLQVMEMALEKLDSTSLPEAELQFISALQQLPLTAYTVGFAVEHAVNQLLGARWCCLGQYDDLAMLRVGSGGRYEGLALGDGEYILLTRDNAKSLTVSLKDFITLLERPISLPAVPWTTKVTVEHKELTSDTPLSYYRGEIGKPFPGRVLEAEFVAGNIDLFWNARRRVFGEILSDKRITDGINGRRQGFRRVCETGIQHFKQDICQFDAAKGIVYHDPKNHLDGLKYSFLRYVQAALELEIYRFLVRHNIPVEDIIDLNQSVEERIRYLLRKRWVANIDGLIGIGIGYVKACDMQGEIKWAYHKDGRTEFKVAPAFFAELQESIPPTFQKQVLA